MSRSVGWFFSPEKVMRNTAVFTGEGKGGGGQCCCLLFHYWLLGIITWLFGTHVAGRKDSRSLSSRGDLVAHSRFM